MTPPDAVVYNALKIPADKHGMGLRALPIPSRGGRPRASMATLIQLVLLGSPRRCLLGYEIVAILKGHFRYYMSATDDWMVRKGSYIQESTVEY